MKRYWLLGLLVLVACDGTVEPPDPPQPTTDAVLRQSLANWGVIPIGKMPEQDPAMVTLGRSLFFDKVLSGNRDVACGTCHQPQLALTDGLSLAVGTGGIGSGIDRVPGTGREFVPRNAPTLLNSGLGLFYMFWEGRLTEFFFGPPQPLADSNAVTFPPGLPNLLAKQAMLPVLNRTEMRGNAGDTDVFGNTNELAQFADDQEDEIWDAVMDRLLAIPEYAQMFTAAFPNTAQSQLGFHHAAQAIATFQMEEFTKTDSPFDRYLDRNDAALTAQQKRGALLFFNDAPCGSCHNGPFLGAQNFANIGTPQVGPGFGRQMPLDLGRGEIDDFEFYRFAFRVAPLRNVELTAPYMHDGAYESLEAVVRHYNDVPVALRDYDDTQLIPELREMVHDDDVTVNDILSTVDFRFTVPLELTEDEIQDLMAFLQSLTDPTARDLSHIAPASVPSGLPVR